MTLDDLQKLCDEATAGPWRHDEAAAAFDRRVAETDTCNITAPSEVRLSNGWANAAFISAFNPQTVKKLLAVAMAAKEIGHECRSHECPMCEALRALEA